MAKALGGLVRTSAAAFGWLEEFVVGSWAGLSTQLREMGVVGRMLLQRRCRMSEEM